jgi:hypothetical protein
MNVFERRRQYRALLATMSRERASVGALEPAVAHFLKVTKSYWRGLFHCYEIAGLPRTNNELEQTFGAVRHAERRATGRKSASPGMVVRGAVRVIAALATRLYEERRRPTAAARSGRAGEGPPGVGATGGSAPCPVPLPPRSGCLSSTCRAFAP